MHVIIDIKNTLILQVIGLNRKAYAVTNLLCVNVYQHIFIIHGHLLTFELKLMVYEVEVLPVLQMLLCTRSTTQIPKVSLYLRGNCNFTYIPFPELSISFTSSFSLWRLTTSSFWKTPRSCCPSRWRTLSKSFALVSSSSSFLHSVHK